MQGKFLIRPLFMGLLAVGALGSSVIASANISTSQSTDGIIAAVNDEIILKKRTHRRKRCTGCRIPSQQHQCHACPNPARRTRQLNHT